MLPVVAKITMPECSNWFCVTIQDKLICQWQKQAANYYTPTQIALPVLQRTIKIFSSSPGNTLFNLSSIQTLPKQTTKPNENLITLKSS